MIGHVIFCHGKLSTPRATKIGWLRPLAHERGHTTEVPDFRGLEVHHRIDVLLACIDEQPGPVAVVGSSMGGAVAVFAAQRKPLLGLYLMAPAVYFPGYDHLDYKVSTPVITVVHGWRDEIVETAGVLRFAEENQAELTMVHDGHDLGGSKSTLMRTFGGFLDAIEGVSQRPGTPSIRSTQAGPSRPSP